MNTCVLNLPINEGQDSTAHDSSGYGNNGTIYGATWTKGSYGYALSFDGVDDYVDCGSNSSLDITDAITVEAWVKCNDDSDFFGILGKGNTGTNGFMLYFRPSSTCWLRWKLVDGGVNYNCEVTTKYQDGNWHHIVATFDGEVMKVFGDGVEVEVLNDGSIGSHSDEHLVIGNWADDLRFPFKGTIAEALIYNRAWTADEVLSYYNATKGRFGL